MIKVKALIKKLEMINSNVSNTNVQTFPNLEQFVIEHELQVEDDIIENIKRHCQMFKKTFEEYFKEDYSEFYWIRNSFVLEVIPGTLTNFKKEYLIELSCDKGLKIEFIKLELDEFWIKN